jgi:hypothetical protein
MGHPTDPTPMTYWRNLLVSVLETHTPPLGSRRPRSLAALRPASDSVHLRGSTRDGVRRTVAYEHDSHRLILSPVTARGCLCAPVPRRSDINQRPISR